MTFTRLSFLCGLIARSESRECLNKARPDRFNRHMCVEQDRSETRWESAHGPQAVTLIPVA